MGVLEVRLLGRPSVLVDGVLVGPPRGAKAWGLLAFLALSARPHPRSELAELLFGEADDPLGALRWNLAALRRLLNLPDALKGDVITLELPEGATIDARLVDQGARCAPDLAGFGQELLAGIGFAGSPSFEVWLSMMRRRLAGRSCSMLRESTLSRLARGELDAAIADATRLVTLDPLDEGHHALLIRALRLAGDRDGARAQLERCRRVLREELGVEPGGAVIAALGACDTPLDSPGGVRPELVAARLAVAWQSFLGGAVDHGIELGRSTVSMSDACPEHRMRVRTRVLLGGMLGMAVRGWDEAATVLSEALHMANTLDRNDDAATAMGMLAGVEMMRAAYDDAEHYAQRGLDLSADPGARSLNLMFLAAVEADTGRIEQAVRHSSEALREADAGGDRMINVYAACHAGRVLLMAGDADSARQPVEQAVDLSSGTMLALYPWPLAMLSEIELIAGHVDAATRHGQRAAALAASTDIAYQRALAGRTLALVAASKGDSSAAVDLLSQALAESRRTTGEGYTYHWPVAFILESLAAVTAGIDAESADRWASTLGDHARTAGMTEFMVRADRLLARSTRVAKRNSSER